MDDLDENIKNALQIIKKQDAVKKAPSVCPLRVA